MRSKDILLKLVLSLVVLSLIQSCTVMRPRANKSGKTLYESFFISIETNQYFIKPLEFKDKDEGSLWLDITFRDKKEFRDSATVNFSLYYPTLIKKIDSLRINNGDHSLELGEINYIYASKKKENYQSRFTSRAQAPSMCDLFLYNSWTIDVYSGQQHFYLTPSSNTRKSIDLLEEDLFMIVRE